MKKILTSILFAVASVACAADNFVTLPPGQTFDNIAVSITNFGAGTDQACRGDWAVAVSNTVAAREAQFATSPTNGAVWICTNTATGQGKWSWPIVFHAYATTQRTPVQGVNSIIYEGIITNVGNCYNGTTGKFIPNVNGAFVLKGAVHLYFFTNNGLPTLYIYKNNAQYQEIGATLVYNTSLANEYSISGSTIIINNNPTNTYDLRYTNYNNYQASNNTEAAQCYFEGALIREIP